MRRLSVRLGAALIAGALACGCAHSPAPKGWLPKSDASVTDAFGGWIVAEIGPGRKAARVEGELIAVEPESVLVLDGDRPVMLAKQAIVRARVAGYDLHASTITTWAFLGAVTTPTHGAWLLISLPMWSLAGGIGTASAVRASVFEYPSAPWTELAKYARFPQGMPAGVPRAALRGKRGG